MNGQTLEQLLAPVAAAADEPCTGLQLVDGAQVAVMGGGPAGSFFSYFFLDMAARFSLDVTVDIFEPRDFFRVGPAGCNMCGGIISESLVQSLAADGINLPPTVVQRGIDSYVMHTDVGHAHIDTPLHEKRIGAVHRGAGPRGLQTSEWTSFDGYLLSLAQKKGANVIPERVQSVAWADGRPELTTRGGQARQYDLLVVSVGVNSAVLKLFEEVVPGYRPPQTTRTFIREYYLGQEQVEASLGCSMHVFLLDIPRLEFAALVPKGDYVSLCMLGEEIDNDLVNQFLSTPEVSGCFPADFPLDKGACQCAPRLSTYGAAQPYADRIVFVGDCGFTRLYKDGIGAAYRTAKAAAATAIFEGVSAEAFQTHFYPACQTLKRDNQIGRIVFMITAMIQHLRFARRALLRMVTYEQRQERGPRRMSTVLWDTFTGSAPYLEIFLRALHPAFLARFAWDNLVAIVSRR